MSKVARRLAVSLIIASIMIVSFAGAAFAAGNDDPAPERNGEINSSYPCDCGTCDGIGPSWNR